VRSECARALSTCAVPIARSLLLEIAERYEKLAHEATEKEAKQRRPRARLSGPHVQGLLSAEYLQGLALEARLWAERMDEEAATETMLHLARVYEALANMSLKMQGH
jgi:hypothetical protein